MKLKYVFGILALMAGIISAEPESAAGFKGIHGKGFNVCNQTNHTSKVLLIVTNSEDFSRLATMGWHTIERGSCKKLMHDASRVKAIYAESNNSIIHSDKDDRYCFYQGNPHKKEAFQKGSRCGEGTKRELTFQSTDFSYHTFDYYLREGGGWGSEKFPPFEGIDY